jgi:transposase-like protein
MSTHQRSSSGTCGEPDASTRRTSGSEGGPGKPVGGDTGTAPRVDPYHVNIRLEEHKLCLLVMVGVRADGRKELVALTDGYRESAESWADLLRDCARRGMRAPALAMGDGALGFWGALREVFPTTREQRCWFHKIANVLGALPRSAHPGAKKALAEIWNAEDKQHALDAVTSFKAAYGAKFGKAVAKITDDLEVLLAFYDYPAEHWIHLRTTDEIVNPFVGRGLLWGSFSCSPAVAA